LPQSTPSGPIATGLLLNASLHSAQQFGTAVSIAAPIVFWPNKSFPERKVISKPIPSMKMTNEAAVRAIPAKNLNAAIARNTATIIKMMVNTSILGCKLESFLKVSRRDPYYETNARACKEQY
jgi:hypothetical protein